MVIKEQDEQRMVIVYSWSQRLGLITPLVLGVPIFAGTIVVNSVVGIVLIIIWGIYALTVIRGKTIILDKLTSNISIKERRFLVINKEQVIPFGDVNKVLATEKTAFFFNIVTLCENYFALWRERIIKQWFQYRLWEINLTVGEKQIKIDATPNQSDMRNLANEISSFIQKP